MGKDNIIKPNPIIVLGFIFGSFILLYLLLT